MHYHYNHNFLIKLILNYLYVMTFLTLLYFFAIFNKKYERIKNESAQ